MTVPHVGRLEAVRQSSDAYSLPHTAVHLQDMMLSLMTSGVYELRYWSCATKKVGPTYNNSKRVGQFICSSCPKLSTSTCTCNTLLYSYVHLYTQSPYNIMQWSIDWRIHETYLITLL